MLAHCRAVEVAEGIGRIRPRDAILRREKSSRHIAACIEVHTKFVPKYSQDYQLPFDVVWAHSLAPRHRGCSS